MQFNRCPYCRDGASKIVVDTDAVPIWKPPRTKTEEIVINHFPDQPIVRFLPHRELAQPCPHLLYLLVDVDAGTGQQPEQSLTLTWLHPWLLYGIRTFSRFYDLWEAVVEPGDPSYVPSTPHQVRQPAAAWRRTRNGRPSTGSDSKGGRSTRRMPKPCSTSCRKREWS